MTMNTILAIDTATEACSAALYADGETYSIFEVCPQQHSQRILPMIERLLEKAGLSAKDIDMLAFGRGPGSFTGVRIATGIIQGLSLGLEKPVVGISTLANMAQQTQGQRIAVAIDARMQEVYYAEFSKDSDGNLRLESEEKVITPELAMKNVTRFAPDAVAGTGWQAYESLESFAVNKDFSLPPSVLYPNAEFLIPLAVAEFHTNGGMAADEITPVYLRDKVTWKKLPGK